MPAPPERSGGREALCCLAAHGQRPASGVPEPRVVRPVSRRASRDAGTASTHLRVGDIEKRPTFGMSTAARRCARRVLRLGRGGVAVVALMYYCIHIDGVVNSIRLHRPPRRLLLVLALSML